MAFDFAAVLHATVVSAATLDVLSLAASRALAKAARSSASAASRSASAA
jgi:hypothetical protein